MRHLLLSLMVLMSAGIFSANVSAQAQACPVSQMAEGIKELAGNFLESDDPLLILRTLENLQLVLPRYEAACVPEENLAVPLPEPKEGLAFSLEGEGSPEDVILSNIEIPTGTYRVEILTNGNFAPRFAGREGFSCRANPDYIRLVNGQANQGAEFLFTSFECSETFTIRANADWRLDFYPILSADYQAIQETYSSETMGLLPVIGPVRIPDGLYMATLVSDGAVSVDLKTVSGQCYMSHGESYLFRYSASAFPQLRSAITSNNCFGYIIFSLASTPWTLTFEPVQ